MVKNLPKLKKETDNQIQEAEGPKQDERNTPMPRQ